MHQADRRASLRIGPVAYAVCMLLMTQIHIGTAIESTFTTTDEDICSLVNQLQFDGTLANQSVGWQVDLGPRLPGSDASLAFRTSITSMLEPNGWEIQETIHERHGMNLTNLEVRWPSATPSSTQVVISAHYDSRNIADSDEDAVNRTLPVPGANDGASGAAVLIELARHIQNMSLDYDVVLFFNDGEDQNDNYTEGAKAWADNLTEQEIQSTQAFILLDMVGDADLQLRNILPGDSVLKQRIVQLAGALGMVSDVQSCDGELGEDIVQYDILVSVLDDHYHASRLNIPSIDIMDPQYGDAKSQTFGTYWHTMQDTPDKVSAESLAFVGRLVELGLRTNAFVTIEDVKNENTTLDSDGQNNNVSDTTREDDILRGSPQIAAIAALGLLGVGLFIFITDRRFRT